MSMSPLPLSILIALAVALVTALAEYWHARRSSGVAKLLYGPAGEPRSWTKTVPVARVVACTLLAWGLTLLAIESPELLNTEAGGEEQEVDPADIQRVILVLDVSPSMNIVDAGVEKKLRRRDRVMEVVEGVLSRIALSRTRFSVVVFFTSARPVVVDALDTNVVRNILDNLPLVWSFEPGETRLLSGLEVAGDLVKDWPPSSTTLFLCTDGDTVDFSQVPELPRSIRKVEILAVGDPLVGTFGDHNSRQQGGRAAATGRRAGGQLSQRQSPAYADRGAGRSGPRPTAAARVRGLSIKDLARIAVGLGALLLALLPDRAAVHRELPGTRNRNVNSARSDQPGERVAVVPEMQEKPMKKWLILAWLLIPVALLSYHFGPGQDALAFRQSQQHLPPPSGLNPSGHFDEAIEAYAESAASLCPSPKSPMLELAVARDQLRLAQIRGRFQLGRLAETLEGLHVLVADVEREHGRDAPLAHDARDFLGRVHYQAMIALRLESAEEEVWRRHWELARQNFRYLAEHTSGARNSLDRQNLEVVIKSFNYRFRPRRPRRLRLPRPRPV